MISGIPIAERFSFCVHTLLSDIATKSSSSRDEIINCQLECLTCITHVLKNSKEQSAQSSPTAQSKLYLCKSTVPVLIGKMNQLL